MDYSTFKEIIKKINSLEHSPMDNTLSRQLFLALRPTIDVDQATARLELINNGMFLLCFIFYIKNINDVDSPSLSHTYSLSFLFFCIPLFQGTLGDAARFSFDVYDVEGNGMVKIRDFIRMLRKTAEHNTKQTGLYVYVYLVLFYSDNLPLTLTRTLTYFYFQAKNYSFFLALYFSLFLSFSQRGLN